MRDEHANLHLIDGRSFARGRSVPKGVEIEPVVRRKSRVVLQAINITLRPAMDFLRALITRQRDLLGKLLEKNFVTIPAAVDTEKQNDRAMHDPGEQDRPGWKCRGRTQALAARRLI